MSRDKYFRKMVYLRTVIEIKKKELDEEIEQNEFNNLNNGYILRKSQELDELIYRYQREKNNLNIISGNLIDGVDSISLAI